MESGSKQLRTDLTLSLGRCSEGADSSNSSLYIWLVVEAWLVRTAPLISSSELKQCTPLMVTVVPHPPSGHRLPVAFIVQPQSPIKFGIKQFGIKTGAAQMLLRSRSLQHVLHRSKRQGKRI